MAIDLIVNRKASAGTLEMICALPSDMKRTIMDEMKQDPGKLIEWYETRTDNYNFDSVSRVTTEVLKELKQ